MLGNPYAPIVILQDAELLIILLYDSEAEREGGRIRLVSGRREHLKVHLPAIDGYQFWERSPNTKVNSSLT
jgi:hypothetical protein